MIEDYKKFLKRNTENIFTGFTIGVGVLAFFLLLLGGVVTGSMVTRYISNNNQMRAYRENLAIYQECAKKISDTSTIDNYCGDAPSEPILIW